MSLSRYEEIVVRFAAASIAAGGYPDLEYSTKTAQYFENFFQEREREIIRTQMNIEGEPVPALLKRQAE